MFVLTHQLGQFNQGFLAIAQYSHIHLHILVDFRRVDIHVDDFRLLGICIQIAGHTVVETHTHGNEHIALIGLDIRPEITMHTEHTFIQRMIRRDGREAEQCTSARNVRLFQECLQFLLGISQFDTLSYQHERLLCRIYQIGRMLKLHTIGIGNGVVATDKVERHRFIVHHLRLRVLREVKHHGTRSSALGDIKSASHRPGHIFRPANLIAPLADGLGHTYQIDLLKGIRTQQ